MEESKKFEEQFICILHDDHNCSYRGYERKCRLDTDHDYVKKFCKYRKKAIVIKECDMCNGTGEVDTDITVTKKIECPKCRGDKRVEV